MYGIILPIDELHHFSRWFFVTTKHLSPSILPVSVASHSFFTWLFASGAGYQHGPPRLDRHNQTTCCGNWAGSGAEMEPCKDRALLVPRPKGPVAAVGKTSNRWFDGDETWWWKMVVERWLNGDYASGNGIWMHEWIIVPFSWEFQNPNWRTPSFFRGVGWNHQPGIVEDHDGILAPWYCGGG